MAKDKDKDKRAESERSLMAWDPFRDLELFEGWPFRELGFPSRLSRRMQALFGGRGEGAGRLMPAMDIHEDDKAYVVTVELPGGKKDDVNVELRDNVLSLSGEKRSERENKDERSRWVERSYGRFSRSFTLPANTDPDRIDANFADGVLTVTVPKTDETKAKTISIRS